ncbi:MULTISPECIES: hypothetical protein [Lonsdalea]|uniref:Uncharacterized protein n=2 Tax=Lonsdalea TaxID=1082702 RepID=A0ACD1JG85_9GAMM|nr:MULTISPECIES: hypothetical protein [Lonsdalea]OSN02732.1 hypothetical protein AU499_01145 [Lonsdalea populi]QPQ25505.1 hypothetical protein I6N93_07005 [Lonsdalea populi]RAT15600.1 hypothetical protein AU485_03190 [Lonsdalea quercina]RAT18240.1 hypothetical protein AU486_01685 [Lonsdalea quercina]RAT23826.1 hypothetical protein AU487_00265 [Lonsdalea populi]
MFGSEAENEADDDFAMVLMTLTLKVTGLIAGECVSYFGGVHLYRLGIVKNTAVSAKKGANATSEKT